jgi:hypothetical protein
MNSGTVPNDMNQRSRPVAAERTALRAMLSSSAAIPGESTT